jgi:hypothetical protein
VPLAAALEAAEVGSIAGGDRRPAEEGREVEDHGVHILVTDREQAIDLILESIRGLAAPRGSVVEEYLPVRRTHLAYPLAD